MNNDKICPICYDKEINIKFKCSHGVCSICYKQMKKSNLNLCPICREYLFKKKPEKKIEFLEDNEIIEIEITIEIIEIPRRRRRNITKEEKIANQQQARKRMKRSRLKKNGRLNKFNHHHSLLSL